MAEQLYITRKRKIWKFAHFDQWANCFQAESVGSEFWAEYFVSSQPLIVEIGAGTADLSVGLARQDAAGNYVAIDVKSDRLYTGAKVALSEGLKNIVFVRAQLRQMDELFAAHSIAELWVTFPDPFPRGRQAKHRLTHPKFLQTYKRLLAPDGILRLKTDNRQLFLWSLEQMVAEGWRIRELSFDLHESDLSDSYKITTHFERKYIAQGVPISCVSATRN